MKKSYTHILPEDLWKDEGGMIFRLAKAVSKFVDEKPYPLADMGEPNLKKKFIEELIGVNIESVHGWDFDYPESDWLKSYGTIFCLEVLEHLMNPLLFLDDVRDNLKDDGVIYLATPYRYHFLWNSHHYHEIDHKRIRWLFEKAGLKIVKEGRARLFNGWKFHLAGVRPLLRPLTFTRIYKLVKSNYKMKEGCRVAV